MRVQWYRVKKPYEKPRHNVVELSFGFSRIEQRQDVRVLEVRRRPDLRQEPLGANDGSELWVEHLKGDWPPVPNVSRE
jgi:hypothetical protein